MVYVAFLRMPSLGDVGFLPPAPTRLTSTHAPLPITWGREPDGLYPSEPSTDPGWPGAGAGLLGHQGSCPCVSYSCSSRCSCPPGKYANPSRACILGSGPARREPPGPWQTKEREDPEASGDPAISRAVWLRHRSPEKWFEGCDSGTFSWEALLSSPEGPPSCLALPGALPALGLSPRASPLFCVHPENSNQSTVSPTHAGVKRGLFL